MDPVRDLLAGHGRSAFSTGVPAGHGHKYSTEYVDAWAVVLQSPEITPDDIDELKAIVGEEE